MWFKQIQLFQFTQKIVSAENLIEKLEPLVFQPCLPSMHASMGWVSPVDEEGAPLVRAFSGCMMVCLQFEEKILPASVIRQALLDKVKLIQTREDRKVYSKEKLALKDEIILTLLPRAFTKLSRVYAYIDTKNQRVILNTTNQKKTEQFISMFKKSIHDDIHIQEVKNLSSLMTSWLRDQSYPTSFSIEKSCVLQDASKQNRVIRCQQQDLFAPSIQALIKDGCAVKQLTLTWEDRISFLLTETFLISGIKFQDEILMQTEEMEAETKQQQFDADFLIMTSTFAVWLNALLELVDHANAEVENKEEVAA